MQEKKQPEKQNPGEKQEQERRRDVEEFPKKRDASDFGTHGGSRKNGSSTPPYGAPGE